jgi:hypothetical protein
MEGRKIEIKRLLKGERLRENGNYKGEIEAKRLREH